MLKHIAYIDHDGNYALLSPDYTPPLHAITEQEIEALEYATDLLHECATRPYWVMPEDIKHIATLDTLIVRLKGDTTDDRP